MSLLIEKANSAKLSLEKKGLPVPPIVRVVAAFDVSGSMENMYRHGDVQSAFDQLLGASFRLDDNGEIDVFIFDTNGEKIGTAKPEDFGSYVNKYIAHKVGGGTDYAPVISLIEDDMFSPPEAAQVHKPGFFGKLFGQKEQAAAPVVEDEAYKLPVLAFFITDGANSDHDEAYRALRSSSKYPIYWNMVGLGNPDQFKFIHKVADDFDNVGFVSLPSLKIEDDKMYELLFTDEFISWAKQFPPRSVAAVSGAGGHA